jgi:hypothetical protein
MSQLEDRAKPYLLKIIAGDDCQLGREAQATVAAWCFKTACVYDQVGRPATIPQQHVDAFYRDPKPVGGVYVHLGRRRRLRPTITLVGDSGALGDPIAQLRSGGGPLEPWHIKFYKTVIVLGEMVAQVLGFTNAEVKGTEMLAAGAARIWPYVAPRAWPSDFTELTLGDAVADVVGKISDLEVSRLGPTQRTKQACE